MLHIPYSIFHIPPFAAEGSSGGIASLGVDVKALILQIITFVLVFWLLKKFALSKIIAMLEKRQQTIDQGVELGLEMVKEKEALETKVAETLRKARLEADKVLAQSHEEAGRMLKEAEAAATRKTATMLADAKAQVEEDLQRAWKGLEKDMRALVAEATEVLIHEKLDAQKDARLVEKALSEVKHG